MIPKPGFERLKSSPIANMALASKELFHSNFLAWVFSSYPTTVNSLLSAANIDLCSPSSGLKVFREKYRLDLMIELGDGRIVVVENKLKSVPDSAQLKRYEEVAEKAAKVDPDRLNFILLTLSEKDWDYVPSGPDRWKRADYGGLSRGLASRLSAISDEYHRAIVHDYAGFVGALSGIANQQAGDIWCRAAVGEDSGGDQSQEWLGTHKLDDLFGKRQGQLVASIVHEQLADRFGDRILWQQQPRDLGSMNVSVYSGFSNSQPLVGVFCALENLKCPDGETPVGIGFQVQGTQFRSYIEWPKPGRFAEAPKNGGRPTQAAEIASSLFEHPDCPRNFWVPRQESAGTKDQCRFGAEFHYRYTRVNPNRIRLDDLADQIVQRSKLLLTDLPLVEGILAGQVAKVR